MKTITQALRKPLSTGAIAQSSNRLARMMVKSARVTKQKSVIEIGPGTGIITKEILKKTKQVHAIEINEGFAKQLKGCKVTIGSAEKLTEYTKPVDCIISGLPWSIFPGSVQETILHQIKLSLKPKGRFVTFAYYPLHMLPNAQAFKRRLEEKFHVERSPIVWGNLPPAFVYICTH